MKAYSIDLRQKIVDTYHNQPISQRQLAKRFCVALSFVQKLLKQYRLTGNVAPPPYRGGVKLKLNEEQLIILAELIEANNDATLLIEANNDATLDELCMMLESKTGVRVSRATMGRMTKRLNFT